MGLTCNKIILNPISFWIQKIFFFNFWLPNFGDTIFFGSKLCLSQKNFGFKILLLKIWPKHFSSQKFFNTIMFSLNFLEQKIEFSPKSFEPEFFFWHNFYDPNCFYQNIFEPKIFCIRSFIWLRFFESTIFLVIFFTLNFLKFPQLFWN